MRAVNGVLSNGLFTPLDGVALPSHIEAVLVFGETISQPVEDISKMQQSAADKQAITDWLNSIKASLKLSRDEDLSNFPKQGQMKVSYDDWHS